MQSYSLRGMRNSDNGHSIVAAPDGVLLDVIQPIPPSGVFAEAFVQA